MADPVSLTTVKGGITRLRTKGAALKDSLYDLVNGYVTAAKTVKVRPGTFRRAVLPEATKGLCSFDGSLHTFCHESVEVPPGYVLHILTHPLLEDSNEDPIPLKEIHFAEPFMGALYVVAEFDVGTADVQSVFHFWLQQGNTWQPNTVYKIGDIVTPSTPNGRAYQATRLQPPSPVWAPGVTRQEGDVVEPTEYNGFKYTVVDTLGDNPTSGTTEPNWPTSDGAQIFEDTEGIVEPVADVPDVGLDRVSDDALNRYGR